MRPRPPHYRHPTLLFTFPPKPRLPSNFNLTLLRWSSSSNPPTPTLLKSHTIPAPHIGHVRILSLNSPSNRNAISRQLLRELSAEIEALRREGEVEERARVARRNGHGDGAGPIGAGTRVLILASELDECFCAGADLKERRSMNPSEYLPPPPPPPPPPFLPPPTNSPPPGAGATEQPPSSTPSATPSPPSPASPSPPSPAYPPSPSAAVSSSPSPPHSASWLPPRKSACRRHDWG